MFSVLSNIFYLLVVNDFFSTQIKYIAALSREEILNSPQKLLFFSSIEISAGSFLFFLLF
jgi:hypothetical protein